MTDNGNNQDNQDSQDNKDKHKTTIIYSIKNYDNDKVFIGATQTSTSQAFSQHKSIYRKGKSPDNPLYKAFDNLDVSKFYIQKEGTCFCKNKDEINKVLGEYYIKFDSIKNGYNTLYKPRMKKQKEETEEAQEMQVSYIREIQDLQDIQDIQDLNEDKESTQVEQGTQYEDLVQIKKADTDVNLKNIGDTELTGGADTITKETEELFHTIDDETIYEEEIRRAILRLDELERETYRELGLCMDHEEPKQTKAHNTQKATKQTKPRHKIAPSFF